MRMRLTGPFFIALAGIWTGTVVLGRRRITRVVGLLLPHRPQRLAVGPVERRALLIERPSVRTCLDPPSIPQMRVCRVSGYESMCLRRHGREDTFLVEAKAVRASAVRRRVEAVASNLRS